MELIIIIWAFILGFVGIFLFLLFFSWILTMLMNFSLVAFIPWFEITTLQTFALLLVISIIYRLIMWKGKKKE